MLPFLEEMFGKNLSVNSAQRIHDHRTLSQLHKTTDTVKRPGAPDSLSTRSNYGRVTLSATTFKEISSDERHHLVISEMILPSVTEVTKDLAISDCVFGIVPSIRRTTRLMASSTFSDAASNK